MNKIAVVYKSKYGSTQKYAKSISVRLNADLFEYSNVKPDNLNEYNTIIFGGGLYAGGINGISLISKNYQNFKNKNLIVFTVGLAATDDEKIFVPIIKKNFTEEMTSNIEFFHMRGGIDYKKLSLVHKPMMAMLRRMVSKKKKEELTKEDMMMLETYGDKVDFTDVKTIEPLISFVKNINTK
jgi:flavodoxin